MLDPTLESNSITLVNHAISDFFKRSIDSSAQIDPSYRELWDNLYTLIGTGGKRLRPQMTLLAYEAFRGTDKTAIIPVAAAHELLHLCLLIHDDIIDRDYVRYGIPNIAGMYMESYAEYIPNPDERTHYANSAALLGGDLLLSGAYQLIASSTLNNKDKLVAQALLSRGMFEVAGGELIDTESSFVPYASGNALKIAEFKCASYSFVTPLLTGATLAGIDKKQAETLRLFARSLGIAYQLVDDILGVFGQEEKTGKSVSGDIREGKRTYMAEQAMAVMTGHDKIRFEQEFGNPAITPEATGEIRALFISTGARQRTEEAIQRYTQNTRDALLLLSLDDEHFSKFEKLINDVTKRSF